MEFPKFIKQHRVLEVRESGKTTFFPQEQYLYFFWKKITRTGYEYLKEEFDTIEQAEEFLFDFQQGQSKRDLKEKAKQAESKFDKETTHSFNAVFYKLKKKDYE